MVEDKIKALIEAEHVASPWFFCDELKTVTLLHGTSEAALPRILKEGLGRKQISPEYTKDIIEDIYFKNKGISWPPGQLVDNTLVDLVYEEFKNSLWEAQDESNGAGTYCVAWPSFHVAEEYACGNASHGGEFPRVVHQHLEKVLGCKLVPRYEGSKPVVLKIDLPKSMMQDHHDRSFRESLLIATEESRQTQKDFSIESIAENCMDYTESLTGANRGQIIVKNRIPPEYIKKIYQENLMKGHKTILSEQKEVAIVKNRFRELAGDLYSWAIKNLSYREAISVEQSPLVKAATEKFSAL